MWILDEFVFVRQYIQTCSTSTLSIALINHHIYITLYLLFYIHQNQPFYIDELVFILFCYSYYFVLSTILFFLLFFFYYFFSFYSFCSFYIFYWIKQLAISQGALHILFMYTLCTLYLYNCMVKISFPCGKINRKENFSMLKDSQVKLDAG